MSLLCFRSTRAVSVAFARESHISTFFLRLVVLFLLLTVYIESCPSTSVELPEGITCLCGRR
jgi:hypothetical protein